MPKYKKGQQGSPQTEEEAMKIARGIQKQGQSKDQTKAIAQGIKKGIDLYKKQQKAKQRELDKNRKKVVPQKDSDGSSIAAKAETRHARSPLLPWILLAVTWTGIAVYTVVTWIN